MIHSQAPSKMIIHSSRHTSCKGGGGGWAGSRTMCAFILGREAYLGFLCWGVCLCSQNIGDGPIKMAPSE